MSPYIVTAKRPCDQSACDRLEPCAAEASGWCAHPNSDDGFGSRAPVSRRAVATLGEAQEACGIDLLGRLEVSLLPESGGTVGPLPDGTVIEVAWVDLPDLVGELPCESLTQFEDQCGATASEVVDAFNAGQS